MKGPLDINSLNSARPAMTLRRRGQRERGSRSLPITVRVAILKFRKGKPSIERGRKRSNTAQSSSSVKCALAESSLAYMCRQDKWEADNAGREIRHSHRFCQKNSAVAASSINDCFIIYLQICQKCRRIGCVIPHCKIQRGITQPILRLF